MMTYDLFKKVIAERIKDYLFRGIEHLLASKRELGRKIEFIRKMYGYTMDANFSTKEIVDKITIFRNLLITRRLFCF